MVPKLIDAVHNGSAAIGQNNTQATQKRDNMLIVTVNFKQLSTKTFKNNIRQ